MKAKIEGKVMTVEVKEYEGKKTMNVGIWQEGSNVIDTVKMTIEEAAALNIKDGALLSCNVNVSAYADNRGNARLSCRYVK